ncbi:MAG: NUDIX hydrolase [Candidatus Woesearchaeota archaeon]
MEESLFHVRTGAYIFNDNNEVLLLQNHDNTWGIPGGHLNNKETIEKGLSREVMEETGINIAIIRLLRLFSKGKDVIVLYYARTSENKVTVSDEHNDYSWVSIEEISGYNLKYAEIIDDIKTILSDL